MRSLVLTLLYLFFLIAGCSAAFVLALGYIWVDLFSPQQVSFAIIDQLPLSMIIGTTALMFYLLFDRRHPPRFGLGLSLIMLWAIWITLTTLWAAMPAAAWVKWNWAIKTVVFAGFLPFLIRSRVQIEAMIVTILLSLSGTIIAGGLRTLQTGGGYQLKLGLTEGNSGLAEGSTLATVSVAIIPLILHVRRWSVVLPQSLFTDCFWFGLILACILTALGSYERTGFVALAVLALCLWLPSKHKVRNAVLGLIPLLAGLVLMPGLWATRMATISDYRTEESALVRIAVWLWTLDYAAAHPFGGGFGVYLIDHFRLPITDDGSFLEINGRAFHSIYFEVLGEQGVVGAVIFASMIFWLLLSLRRVAQGSRLSPNDAWLGRLAGAIACSSLIYLAGGAFVGIAFQPLFYYWFAAALCLQNYLARTSPVWQSQASPIAALPRLG
jgi:probable O-glycosylation ligase (exosortase A-associated)